MWVAQGFVDTSKYSDIEFAARECFDILLATSFIQAHKTPAGKEYYTIHDLLQDLAERVAGSDCFRIEKDMVDHHQIPPDVRHLFINSDNLGELMNQIVERKNLRTLIMSSSAAPAAKITAEDFKRMLGNLKQLRFVHVFLEVKKELKDVIPDCIGELKHLRYLSLDWMLSHKRVELPLAFTHLYHLQGIAVPFDTKLHSSHHEIADLENLRHIIGARLSIPHIGRMKWLQTVLVFTVKKEKGYETTQLKNLDNIHGEMYIWGLENIPNKEEARGANLSEKLYLKKLTFDWESWRDNDTGGSSSSKKQKTDGHIEQVVSPPKPEEILEALHPPALLEELTIESYIGSTFPSWLSGEEDGKLECLERLVFGDCHESDSQSQLKFGKTLPGLHKLEIECCSWNALPDNMEQLASLEELTISECENIKSLPGLPSSLKKLIITECENIKKLPELPPSLKELEIAVCGNIKTLPELPPSLKKLKIVVCRKIKILPKLPPSLEELCCEKALVKSYLDRQAIDRIKTDIW